MWKIAAAGIAFTLLAVCLKQIKEEYRTYLMLAAGLLTPVFAVAALPFSGVEMPSVLGATVTSTV